MSVEETNTEETNTEETEGKRVKKRITSAEYAAVKILLASSVSPESLEAARWALVDGKSYGEVAAAFNISRQGANKSAKKVTDTLKLYREAQFAENLALQLMKSEKKKKKSGGIK